MKRFKGKSGFTARLKWLLLCSFWPHGGSTSLPSLHSWASWLWSSSGCWIMQSWVFGSVEYLFKHQLSFSCRFAAVPPQRVNRSCGFTGREEACSLLSLCSQDYCRCCLTVLWCQTVDFNSSLSPLPLKTSLLLSDCVSSFTLKVSKLCVFNISSCEKGFQIEGTCERIKLLWVICPQSLGLDLYASWTFVGLS